MGSLMQLVLLFRGCVRSVKFICAPPLKLFSCCLLTLSSSGLFLSLSPPHPIYTSHLLSSLLNSCLLASISTPSPSPRLPPSLSLSLPAVQWRASGWSGARGQNAAWPATRGPRWGKGAAVPRCMAGLSVRGFIRRAGNAPTLHAVVRRRKEKKSTQTWHFICFWTTLCKHRVLRSLKECLCLSACECVLVWQPNLNCLFFSFSSSLQERSRGKYPVFFFFFFMSHFKNIHYFFSPLLPYSMLNPVWYLLVVTCLCIRWR